MAANIQLITDSTCDLPQSIVDDYGITVVPHYVIWGNQEYRDRINLQPEEFYRRLETDPMRPTSSQAGIPDFLKAYEKAIERGAQELIVVTVSAAMSGAYQMASSAAKLVSIPVHVIDSKGPTMSLGWQVLAAVRGLADGLDVPSVLTRLEKIRENLVQLVGMHTLEYLQKGGRIGGAVKWVGTLLNIKPLVSINHQTGLVEPIGLSRTHKGMVEMLYRKFFEKLDTSRPVRVAVLHGNAPEEAQTLIERIRADYSPVEIITNITGPVLGINTGPRALALCGYSE